MGRILCERHGASGIAHACPHLIAAIHAATAAPRHTTYRLHLDGDELFHLQLCEPCVRAHQLPDAAAPLALDEWHERLGTLLSSVCCSRCYDERIARP